MHGIINNPVDVEIKCIGFVIEGSLSVEQNVISDSFHRREVEIDSWSGWFIDCSGLISDAKAVGETIKIGEGHLIAEGISI